MVRTALGPDQAVIGWRFLRSPATIPIMSLTVSTDPAAIRAELERLLAADPVRNTILGSIVADLRADRTAECWFAALPGTNAVAIRSNRVFPLLFTTGWDPDGITAVVKLAAELPDLVGISGPVEIADAAASAFPGRRIRERMAMRLFRLDELSPPHDVPGSARPASAEDRAQIVAWFKAFTAEAGGILGDVEGVVDEILRSGAHWLWIDGDRPVALASRRSVEGGSARIGPVYTPPGERGRGYGSAATSAATRDVLDLGAVPVLFTDLDNPTSNKIYQTLGYDAVEDRAVIIFD